LGAILLTPETNEAVRQILPFTAINDVLKRNGGSEDLITHIFQLLKKHTVYFYVSGCVRKHQNIQICILLK